MAAGIQNGFMYIKYFFFFTNFFLNTKTNFMDPFTVIFT